MKETTDTNQTPIKKEWTNPEISELSVSETNQLNPPNADDPLAS